jgi:hypothetical protein
MNTYKRPLDSLYKEDKPIKSHTVIHKPDHSVIKVDNKSFNSQKVYNYKEKSLNLKQQEVEDDEEVVVQFRYKGGEEEKPLSEENKHHIDTSKKESGAEHQDHSGIDSAKYDNSSMFCVNFRV